MKGNWELDIRVIVVSRTFADIAAIPMCEKEDLDPIALQRLATRVPEQLHTTEYDVLPAQLIPHPKGFLRFPKYEVMATAYGIPRAIVFFTDQIDQNLEKQVRDAFTE